MRASSGTILGIANATMRLHVKEMSKMKWCHLANIICTLSEDEGEKSPAGTSSKVVVSKGRGEVDAEAPKDVSLSEDNRSARTVHTVGSGDAMAAGTSEERPPEETLDERGELP